MRDYNITFYTYGSTLELNGVQLDAGRLSEDLLNLSSEDYRPMHERMERITELEQSYAKDKQLSVWWELNEEMASFCQELRRYTVFRLLLDEDEDRFFSVFRQITEQHSLFPDEKKSTVERIKNFLDSYLKKQEESEEPTPQFCGLFDHLRTILLGQERRSRPILRGSLSPRQTFHLPAVRLGGGAEGTGEGCPEDPGQAESL